LQWAAARWRRAVVELGDKADFGLRTTARLKPRPTAAASYNYWPLTPTLPLHAVPLQHAAAPLHPAAPCTLTVPPAPHIPAVSGITLSMSPAAAARQIASSGDTPSTRSAASRRRDSTCSILA
jgi:hypothetical protein